MILNIQTCKNQVYATAMIPMRTEYLGGTGALDHYRFAHAFDHLYGVFRRRIGVDTIL